MIDCFADDIEPPVIVNEDPNIEIEMDRHPESLLQQVCLQMVIYASS